MKDSAKINVNAKVLIWARESIVLSKNQASERSKVNSKRLSQLESGERLPTIEELRKLSKTYKRTIATLLLQKVPKELPLPKDRRSINSAEIGQFHEKTIMAVRKARALAQSIVELRDEMNIRIPGLKLKSSVREEPKKIANKVSEILQLSQIREIEDINIALEGYIEKVESLGVAVFQLSLTQDGLRGFSITDDIIPIIAIKRGSEPTHSKTFTLFHELGHILLNEGAMCDISPKTRSSIEKWCNAFSAEVLAPTSDILSTSIVNQYRRNNNKIWAKKDLIELGKKFHVGPLMILRRLLDNGLTTKEYYALKHVTWNKPSFGRSKNPKGREVHKEAYKERGRANVSLAFDAYDQNKIGIKDLSDFLGLKFSYLSKTRALLNS